MSSLALDEKKSGLDLPSEAKESDELERRTFRSVSWRILPIFCMYTFVGSMEKSNLSYASSGLMESTGIDDKQYGLAGTVFIVAYAASTIPTVLLAKRIGAARGLAIMMFSFGVVTCATAGVSNLGGLLVTRVFLGITEAGVNQTMVRSRFRSLLR